MHAAAPGLCGRPLDGGFCCCCCWAGGPGGPGGGPGGPGGAAIPGCPPGGGIPGGPGGGPGDPPPVAAPAAAIAAAKLPRFFDNTGFPGTMPSVIFFTMARGPPEHSSEYHAAAPTA